MGKSTGGPFGWTCFDFWARWAAWWMPWRVKQALIRSFSEMAGHFLVKWVVKLSILPLGKFSPHALHV
jgi:hypothetical protein